MHDYLTLRCSRFDDPDLAVMAARRGSVLRFVRRSCEPNCSVEQHRARDGLHLILRTRAVVRPGVELTVPFEFDVAALRVPFECACNDDKWDACPTYVAARERGRARALCVCGCDDVCVQTRVL
jgi:hypothetical protein